METELKLLLADSSDLDRLLEALDPPSRLLHQRNTYYDDQARTWAQAGLALRLRWVDDRCTLTIKGRGHFQGRFSVRPEAEIPLDREVSQACAEGGALLARLARGLAVDHGMGGEARDWGTLPLRVVGTLHTLRRICHLPGDYRDLGSLEVDTTTYPDGSVRWEVEAEREGTAVELAAIETRLRGFFEERGIAWQPSRGSKREVLGKILEGERDA